MADPLYAIEGTRLVPGALTVGPWSADAQHGGPVAALLARAVEQVEAPVHMQVVRLTVELLRPVPLTPLLVQSVVSRHGKKVQLVEASVFTGGPDGTEVARARALRIRISSIEGVPTDTAEPPAPPPDPSSAAWFSR